MIVYKALTPVKAITFDLDDTLYENTSVIVAAQKALDVFIQQNFPQARALPSTYWRQHQAQAIRLNPCLKHDMSELRLVALRNGFKALGMSGEQASEAAEKSYQVFYAKRSDFEVREQVHNLLSALSKRVPLVAITNGNVCLHKIGISAYFSESFKANVNMPMKPDSCMFNAAQQHLTLAPQDILHVGDNLQKDVMGAIKAGYQAAWYADDRAMHLTNEPVSLLPHIQLATLDELLGLV